MIFSVVKNLFNNSQQTNYYYRLALDIGTEYVKAMVVKFDKQYICEIIGYGRVKQETMNMEGGAISDIEEVIKKCHEAINQALERTEVEPEEIVMGIAGEFVKGVVTNISDKRFWAKRPLTQSEINSLVYKAQQQAMEEAEGKLLTDMGLDDLKVRLINSSVVDMKIDGYRITNPEEFQGKNLEVSVFSTFAPLVHVGALETIAERLGYELVGIIAEPFAVAKSIMSEEAYEFGAIVIDIGGGTTDIALIRNGGIEGTKMFSLAGRAFTRSLAREFNLSFAQAEKLKLKYSADKLSQGADKVGQVIRSDLNLLYEGIEVALNKLAQGEALPQKVYLCGGGSALKGLFAGMRQWELYEELPFFKQPEVKLLTGDKIEGIQDTVDQLKGPQDVTPRSLALQSTMVQEIKRRGLWKRLVANLG